VQRKRSAGTSLNSNADTGQTEVREICRSDETGRGLAKVAMQQLQMSARAFHRILKLARTIADPCPHAGLLLSVQFGGKIGHPPRGRILKQDRPRQLGVRTGEHEGCRCSHGVTQQGGAVQLKPGAHVSQVACVLDRAIPLLRPSTYNASASH
jgi:hypothetical protein